MRMAYIALGVDTRMLEGSVKVGCRPVTNGIVGRNRNARKGDPKWLLNVPVMQVCIGEW